MYRKEHLTIVFLLGIIVGLVGWNVVTLMEPEVHADSGAATGGFIMATGLVSNNFEGLWILDTKVPSLCLYVPRNQGRKFFLSACRRIKYDHQLVALNDESRRNDRNLSVGRLKSAIDQMNKEAEDE